MFLQSMYCKLGFSKVSDIGATWMDSVWNCDCKVLAGGGWLRWLLSWVTGVLFCNLCQRVFVSSVHQVHDIR